MLRSYRKLLPFVRPHGWRLFGIGILSLLLAVAASLQPWPLKILVDHALGDTPAPPALQVAAESTGIDGVAQGLTAVAVAVGLLLFGFRTLLDAALRWLWCRAGQGMVYELGEALYARLMGLSPRYHATHSTGDSLTRISTDSYCIYLAVQGLLVTPAQALLTIAVIGMVAWQLDPQLTVLSVVLAPVLGGSALFFGNKMKRESRKQADAQAELAGFVHDTYSVMPLVQAFDTADRNRGQFSTTASEVVRYTQRGSFYKNAFGLANGVTIAAGVGLVLFVGGQRVLAGAVSIGTLLIFLEYLRAMQGAFRKLMEVYGFLKVAEAHVDRVHDVLESSEHVSEKPGAIALKVPDSPQETVRMEHVSVRYDREAPALNGLSLIVKAGETVAIVGPTGSGKSTLLSLIPRFFDPDAGDVFVFGENVRDLTLRSLRAQIGLVMQEPFLLPVSVAENIALGRPEADRNTIVQAAEDANADAFIRSLPEGYDTVVGEQGATLSGGQRQRLAIARALLRDAPILLLDEPTSALDVETETQLLQALDRLMAGRTTFIVAHRLSTIRNADRIIVLDEGAVVETGTYDALLAKGGLFARLHVLQQDEGAA
jgi:ATP-binding cassette subfamily B protein/subfamily B ATP-binding cassette protein MsbA